MIVVFGSLNIDMVMQVEQMPRPGDTILCPSYQLIPGGKGANQAVAVSKAGAKVKLFGKIGDDEFGKIILSSLKKSAVNFDGVKVCQHPISTGCAFICIDAMGENIITVASGANLHAKQADIPDSILSKEAMLILQMETPEEENWQLIHRAKKAGARIILNLAPAKTISTDILRSLDILVLNQLESTVLALHLGFEVISPSTAARMIAANFKITCIVTLGSEGAIACTPTGNWTIKAMDIKAIDTTSAGDAFVGALAASLDKGDELPIALRRASVASGLACTKIGAQTSLPRAQQIEDALKQIPPPRKIA